jgi:hypothetical protein
MPLFDRASYRTTTHLLVITARASLILMALNSLRTLLIQLIRQKDVAYNYQTPERSHNTKKSFTNR